MPRVSPSHPSRQNLKVLIAATPKTGNVWLKNLLANIYSLRIVDLDTAPDDASLNDLGTGWIAHQHLSPTAALLKRLHGHHVIVLTMFRHPGDVLVSLKSFLSNLNDPQASDRTASTLLDDGNVFGANALRYVRSSFPNQVNLSLFWAKTGAHPIRYEDLLSDAEKTLQSLGSQLSPAPVHRIREAMEQSSIEQLRKRHTRTAFHFRQGHSGKWRTALPENIKETFRHLAPYPAQFQALGYSMDESQEGTPSEEPAVTPKADGPKDAPSSEFLCTLFDELPAALTAGWNRPSPSKIFGPYLTWLNSFADKGRAEIKPAVPITNAAKAIHDRRPDLHRAFPDIFDADRLGFATWFLLRSETEYGLELSYRTPILEAIAQIDSVESGV